ncbi:MAG: isoprenoid biosynthesis glyoxalase ElbB [Candidatus Dasytiphilus stammeri]
MKHIKNKKIAVILSGCGVYDGTEINEAVLTLLSLEENQLSYQCFAPDIMQTHVINHVNIMETTEKRNVLIESARIVRGKIKSLDKCEVDEFASLIIPGGYGVIKNLCNFALKGENMEIHPSLLRILKKFKNQYKPTGYICIAPLMLPLVYGPGIRLTVGNDQSIINIVEKLGGVHEITKVFEVIIDWEHKVVTTPAYMLASSIMEAKQGIDKMIETIKQMIYY